MDRPLSVHPNVTRNIWDASDWILIKRCFGGKGDDGYCFIVAFYKLHLLAVEQNNNYMIFTWTPRTIPWMVMNAWLEKVKVLFSPSLQLLNSHHCCLLVF